MKTIDVAVVGEIYVDHVLTGFAKWPEPGEEVFTDEYVREVGGGAAITACALARLGRTVSLIGIVGEKEMPWIEQRLASFGVPSAGLRRTSGSTGVTVSVSSSVDRSFFTFRGENKNLEGQLANRLIAEQLAQARHVHFAMPLTLALAEHLLQTLHSADCSTSLDVGHQVAWLQDEVNRRTCSKVDYMLPNEREAKILCACDARHYLDFTKQQQWPSGVVKMGAAGAMMRSDNGALQVRSPGIVAVDTTGAGDAFDAGFIDGLLDKAGAQECLGRGCVCGGLSTRAAGALQGLPTRNELQECYEESYG
jgi:sugar/nucleoside kinase (ribokinase family)